MIFHSERLTLDDLHLHVYLLTKAQNTLLYGDHSFGEHMIALWPIYIV